MRYIRLAGKLLVLCMVLVGAIALDFIAYNFLSACPGCTSFSYFLSTPVAISGPVLASIGSLLALTKKSK